MKPRYFLVLALMLMCASSALCTDTLTPSGDSRLDIKLWVAICGALGTLTTTSINVGRWIRERSSLARKVELLSHALKLKDFLDSENALRAAVGAKAESAIAASTAKGELLATLTKLDASPRPVSKLRRFMLLYAPKGFRAWLAHSLFYAFCIFSGVLTIAVFSGDEEFKSGELVMGVLAITLVGILFQRWAALEYRISSNLRLEPKAIGSLFWYPANNRYGFLAQIMLVSGIAGIVSFVTAFLPTDPLSVSSVPSPTWELVLGALFQSAFLPVGYCWTQAEFRYSEQPTVSQAGSKFLKMIFHTRTAEQLVGSFSLLVLTIWNIVLLLEFRAIPMDASFPDANGFGEMGMANAVMLHFLPMIFVGWLPWLAVYRGLWALYGDGPRTIERSVTVATEDSNG